MGLHTAKEIELVGFGAYWAESARQIPDKGNLSAYWIGISSAGDFFGTTASYASIRDSMLRLCHRLIACSIARRSQAPDKVIVTDLFYLRGMDVGLVNIPYLLARFDEEVLIFCLRVRSLRLLSRSVWMHPSSAAFSFPAAGAKREAGI
ncbi:hypothetical protein Tco_1417889 [Tanacetum coccineum]